MRAAWGIFKKLPGLLQRQILQRIGLCCLMLALSIITWIATSNLTLTLPGLALMGYLGVSGCLLANRGICGKYICVVGIVKRVEVTGLRKKVKWLFLDVEGRTVQCPVSSKQKNLAVNDGITLCLSPSTPIYEQDGVYRIFDYLAMEQIQEKH